MAGAKKRVFSYCGMKKVAGSGSRGYSVCFIPKGQNDAQGGIMFSFYYVNRVIPGNAFAVEVSR